MELDYKSILEVARALREQIDWPSVRERTSESPFAKAFFTLVEELERRLGRRTGSTVTLNGARSP